METKRSWLLYWLLFSSVPTFAAEYAGYQGWLQLEEELAGYAGGPTGYYSIQFGGKSYDLKTYSYQKSWDDIEALIILLRDRTSGKTSYAGGRVAEVHFPKGAPPERMTIDLNRTYSFLCAHSSFYNCPLVLTTRIDAELNYGEKYPPLFSSTTKP